MLDKTETRDLYRKRAGGYDKAILLYRLMGFQEKRYRQETVDALALKPGDRVVEIGCGTGLNFSYLQRAVGPGGGIIGVDLTDRMLDEACQRVGREGWRNVELVRADASQYEFPAGIGGVLSTLAITLMPEYDAIIQRAAAALRPGGRLAILDFKEPDWPGWMVNLAVWLTKPYGVSLDIAGRRPWESVRRYLKEKLYKEYYFGAMYLSVGEAANERSRVADSDPCAGEPKRLSDRPISLQSR